MPKKAFISIIVRCLVDRSDLEKTGTKASQKQWERQCVSLIRRDHGIIEELPIQKTVGSALLEAEDAHLISSSHEICHNANLNKIGDNWRRGTAFGLREGHVS